MIYPTITGENFDETTNRLTIRSDWNGHRLKVRKPRTRREFYDMTKALYGVGLGVYGKAYEEGGRYEIDGYERKYGRLPIPALWDKKYGQYDGLRLFLDSCFGPLVCGGVARSHYGHFKCSHSDSLRLKKFFGSEFVPSDPKAKG